MSSKICTKCKVEKELTQYNKCVSWCKPCLAVYKKEYSQKNKEKLSQKKREYYQQNREKLLTKVKTRSQQNKKQKHQYDQARYYVDLERSRQKSREQYYSNKETYIVRNTKNVARKYQTDPLFKLRNRVSCEIKRALRKLGSSKRGHSIMKYLPYTIIELKAHLEQQFEPWMTWQNWGVYRVENWNDNDSSTWTWQIDHIIPQADLPYTSMEDENFGQVWALSNLRPYSSKLNLLDGASRKRHENDRR
jgi:hypothetical protein